MPPGAGINVQGQSLVLPEGKEGGLTLDQRAMVCFPGSARGTTDSRPSRRPFQLISTTSVDTLEQGKPVITSIAPG
jgi:hypothetical protein